VLGASISPFDPIRTSGGNDFASKTCDVCRSSVSAKSFSLKIYKTDGTFRSGANMYWLGWRSERLL
jgi:hypothetical protein